MAPQGRCSWTCCRRCVLPGGPGVGRTPQRREGGWVDQPRAWLEGRDLGIRGRSRPGVPKEGNQEGAGERHPRQVCRRRGRVCPEAVDVERICLRLCPSSRGIASNRTTGHSGVSEAEAGHQVSLVLQQLVEKQLYHSRWLQSMQAQRPERRNLAIFCHVFGPRGG